MSSPATLHIILALLVSILVIAAQAWRETPDARAADSEPYMTVAKTLHDTGIYTDGSFDEKSAARGANGQGMFFSPLYPAFVAGAMALDPAFEETISCHAAEGARDHCGHDFGILRYMQIALAALSAFLVWLAGWVVTGRVCIAWLALALSFLTGSYAYYTAQIMTENLVFPLFSTACLAAAAAWKTRNPFLWFLCGMCIGLATLTRPPFSYLLYAGLPALALGAFGQKNLSWRKKISWPLLLLAGYALTAGPWILRNGVTMSEYTVSSGYAPFILYQRVSYNDMTWKEWAIAFIYYAPDFGDSLSRKLFDAQDYERLGFQDPDGFYQTAGATFDDAVDRAGGVKNLLPQLLEQEVIGNLFKHVMVTLPLAWRGMWIAKIWGMVTIPLFAVAFVIALRRRWAEFLIFAVPPWFMLGLHAFTSVNVTRYNLILIPCLAIGAAFLLDRGISFIKTRYKPLQKT